MPSISVVDEFDVDELFELFGVPLLPKSLGQVHPRATAAMIPRATKSVKKNVLTEQQASNKFFHKFSP
jgi:hypothetical protein